MGPSLNPPRRSLSSEGSQPVMTFRPPGTTPVSIVADPESQPAVPKPIEKPEPMKPGGSKVAVLFVGILVLAAIGVATGWFLTQ